MKTLNTLRVLIGLAAIQLTGMSSQAQQMPQDNWRYDGLQFSAPDSTKALRSIAIGPGGVYVGQIGSATTTNPAIAVLQFQETGTFVRQFGAVFTYILGIACDSAGNVYVLDRGDSKVKAFDQNGVFLRDWGGPGVGNGQFSIAAATGTSMISVDKNNQIYVCDPGNTRVQVFDANGNFLRKWGELGSLPGQFASGDPDSITVLPNGWAAVFCSTAPKCRVFDSTGGYLNSKNELGAGGSTQTSVVASSSDGLLFVLCYTGNLVSGLLPHDLSLDQVLPYPGNGVTGANVSASGFSISPRGDVYIIGGTAVRVYEREYSNVHNALVPTAIPQPVVLNVAQRAGVPLLDVDYKVTDPDSATVTTGALAFLSGNNTLFDVVPMNTFVEGTASNIGANQATNVEKRITWDMATDWSVDFAQIQVEVLAKDNRNPLGIHWVTVPAEGGQPAIQISRQPVADTRLLDLWYWYVATQQSGMSFANGQIKGTAGLFYNGSTLASGTSTTPTGRLFAYEKLGMRAISGSELSRALAGNYGFVSVDSNSVVREAVPPSVFVQGWGDNTQGQTTGSVASVGAVAIAAGSNHSLALKGDGTVAAFGWNQYGQTTIPAGLDGVTAIAAGSIHSLARKSNGTVVAWGYNGNGETAVPVGLTAVTAIAAGSNNSLALKGDGTVVAWGYNPTPIPADWTGLTAIAAGSGFRIALKNNGTVVAWGTTVPAGLTDVIAIAAGGSHCLALKIDGTVVAWGLNTSGQTTVPAGLTGVTAISAGGNHSLALKGDGAVVAWGLNTSGQTIVPAGLTGVTAIAAGGGHSLVIVSAP